MIKIIEGFKWTEKQLRFLKENKDLLNKLTNLYDYRGSLPLKYTLGEFENRNIEWSLAIKLYGEENLIYQISSWRKERNQENYTVVGKMQVETHSIGAILLGNLNFYGVKVGVSLKSFDVEKVRKILIENISNSLDFMRNNYGDTHDSYFLGRNNEEALLLYLLKNGKMQIEVK